jgi:hypothetical protein
VRRHEQKRDWTAVQIRRTTRARLGAFIAEHTDHGRVADTIDDIINDVLDEYEIPSAEALPRNEDT